METKQTRHSSSVRKTGSRGIDREQVVMHRHSVILPDGQPVLELKVARRQRLQFPAFAVSRLSCGQCVAFTVKKLVIWKGLRKMISTVSFRPCRQVQDPSHAPSSLRRAVLCGRLLKGQSTS